MLDFVSRLKVALVNFSFMHYVLAIISLAGDVLVSSCHHKILVFLNSRIKKEKKLTLRDLIAFVVVVNIAVLWILFKESTIGPPPPPPPSPSPSSSPIIEVGDIVVFGTYKQSMDKERKGVRQNIKWIVIAKQDDQENERRLLLAENGLIYKEVSDTKAYWRPWSSCYLKDWLNAVFYSEAFSPEEQNVILNTDEMLGNVFCLSKKEVEDYFLVKSERICKPTDYAYNVCLGNPPTSSGKQPTPNKDADYWWLRDHGLDERSFLTVSDTGDIHTRGTQGTYAGIMVRPAIWLDLKAAHQAGVIIKLPSNME